MSFHWKIGKLAVLALLWLVARGVSFAPAQTSASTAKNIKGAPAAPDENARLKKYLDKDGGYKTKDGGYYNPKAGTYTEFSSVWSAYFRPLLAKAMVGEAPVDQVMKDGAQRWTEFAAPGAARGTRTV